MEVQLDRNVVEFAAQRGVATQVLEQIVGFRLLVPALLGSCSRNSCIRISAHCQGMS